MSETADNSPEALLDLLRQGTSSTHEIKIRGLIVPVRVLSMDEQLNVKQTCQIEARKLSYDAESEAVLVQKMTLTIASTPLGGAPMLGKKFMAAVTVDELLALYQEYIRIMDSVNPSIESIPAPQFRSLVDALKKKQLSAIDCNLQQLRAICTAFVDLILRVELAESQQDKSSGGPSSE